MNSALAKIGSMNASIHVDLRGDVVPLNEAVAYRFQSRSLKLRFANKAHSEGAPTETAFLVGGNPRLHLPKAQVSALGEKDATSNNNGRFKPIRRRNAAATL